MQARWRHETRSASADSAGGAMLPGGHAASWAAMHACFGCLVESKRLLRMSSGAVCEVATARALSPLAAANAAMPAKASAMRMVAGFMAASV